MAHMQSVAIIMLLIRVLDHALVFILNFNKGARSRISFFYLTCMNDKLHTENEVEMFHFLQIFLLLSLRNA